MVILSKLELAEENRLRAIQTQLDAKFMEEEQELEDSKQEDQKQEDRQQQRIKFLTTSAPHRLGVLNYVNESKNLELIRPTQLRGDSRTQYKKESPALLSDIILEENDLDV